MTSCINWTDLLGSVMHRRTGDLGLLPPRAVEHGGARFCCFDAIFVVTRGMGDFFVVCNV